MICISGNLAGQLIGEGSAGAGAGAGAGARAGAGGGTNSTFGSYRRADASASAGAGACACAGTDSGVEAVSWERRRADKVGHGVSLRHIVSVEYILSRDRLMSVTVSSAGSCGPVLYILMRQNATHFV